MLVFINYCISPNCKPVLCLNNKYEWVTYGSLFVTSVSTCVWLQFSCPRCLVETLHGVEIEMMMIVHHSVQVVGSGFISLRIGKTGSWERGNAQSGSMKGGE